MAESCCRGHPSLPDAQARKPHPIGGRKSVFSAPTKNQRSQLPPIRAKRKMNEQTSTTQAKGVKVMKLRLIATIVTGATAAMLASAAFGQANPQNSGYVLFQYGTPANNIWRSGSYGGKPGVNDTLCWRTGYWTPAMAIVECDPDLVPKPPAPAPAPAVKPPAPPPAPAPAPAPAVSVQKITLAAKALFDFDKSVLKPEGKAAIDSEVTTGLKSVPTPGSDVPPIRFADIG